MLSFVFQATSKIKEYAKVVSIGKLLYFAIIIVCLFIGINEYRLMIIGDLIGILVSLLYAIYISRDIVFIKPMLFIIDLKIALQNISIGSKLMLANIASMLVIGVVRFGIERVWDVETFGKVSLTLSVSNLLMVFINAVGIIIFPILRRTNESKLSDIYSIMRDFLTAILFGLLVGYYPIRSILSAWLPKYSESLRYMALVFPMFIYEGKMALLINSYLKTLRKEKLMLKLNVISVLISLFFTVLTTLLLKNLDFAVLSIVVILAIRSVLAESVLSKLLSIDLKKDILLELALTLIFILSGWFINSWITTIVYGTAYVSYLYIKRKEVRCTADSIRMLIKA
jgi:O-antigen/teichoic acid export membrane protein